MRCYSEKYFFTANYLYINVRKYSENDLSAVNNWTFITFDDYHTVLGKKFNQIT